MLFVAVFFTSLVLPAAAHAAQTATVVSPKRPLNVRAGPAVWTAQLRAMPNGAAVSIECQIKGQLINQGSVRVTDQWDRLTDGSYVSDAWIRRGSAVPPPCGAAQAQAAPAAPATVTTAGAVASGSIPLKARTGPAHGAPLVASLANGTQLTMICQQRGETIAGTVRTTPMWNRLANGTYVSDAYVRRTGTPPPCLSTAPVAPPVVVGGTWVSPLPGFSARPGFRTSNNPNHIGVDIMSFVGTPIHAAAAGTVTEVVCNIEVGHSCDQAGSAAVGGCGWYVKIQHAGGIATLYCHMVSRAIVKPGQQVAAGQAIGYVGISGNSSAPHLHFEVHVNTPPTGPQNAVDPLPFMRAHGAPIG